jgi:hypothetical protein
MFGIVTLYRRIKIKQLKNDSTSVKQHQVSDSGVEEKIVRLSISTCRTWLYMLTCVTILAVDFNIFPRFNAKTETFGISLMDLGVGFFIVCHSMKLIRNSSNLIEPTRNQLVE